MSDDTKWEFYMCSVGKPPSPALVRVDLALHDGLPDDVKPDEVRPMRIDVTVGIARPDSRGLPATEEALRGLDELRDELSAAAATAGAVHLGSIAVAAELTYFFQGPALDPVAAALAPVLAERVPGRPKVTGNADPAWSLYRGFLWPNDLAWGWMRDRDTLHELEQHGDDGTAPRIIEHLAVFPTAESRTVFATTLQQSGFTEVELREPTEEDASFAVRFRSELAPHEHIHGLAESLRDS